MELKTIQEAKKYIGKTVYTAHNLHTRRSEGKNKVYPLYICGVYLFFNQVGYDVVGFELYEDVNGAKGWGEVKLERIGQEFDQKKSYTSYFFSKEEAEKYCKWMNADEKEREKERALETAKELLTEHGIKFEIFE